MNSFLRPATVQKDMELVQPPTDSISKISFSPTQDVLAVASWDNNVRFYDVNAQGQSQPKAMYNHEAPVLDLAWSSTGQHLFSSGCDNAVRMYDLGAQGAATQVAAHDAPVKCVRYIDEMGGMIVTAGWDKKLRYWDLRQSNPAAELQLSDKAYSMDVGGKLLVVAAGNRKIDMINLNSPGEIAKTIDSPLKWQSRCVAVFPGTGESFALGSVEGRVAIQYPTDDPSKNYSFKCHRMDIAANSMPGTPAVAGNTSNTTSQQVFAVNDITFHKQFGTFVTAGSDGGFTIWDGQQKTKIKQFNLNEINNGDQTAKPPKAGTPIVSTSFNHNGSILAYAMSYDWSKGHSGVPPANQNVTKVMLHPVKPDEVQKKKTNGR